MSLEAGTQLGAYSILGPLGAGGMGEVYRATDTKLDREVAVKVLPDVMAHDPERVARFEREAKLLASLSHPQIGAIHGFEQAEGKRFLVLELIEGPTLAERIAAGPLMVEESLDIARQIAEALEAAHEKGIIHRDLKPANVKITPDGTVKVLDFGLAKALAEESTEDDPGTSPTITHNFTEPGVILGTAAYMSPEQARGHAVDKRSDIWSFGCVLYECLTGDSMFLGETVTDSIGAILHKQPDWERLPTDTPPTVQLLLRRSLSKDRKRRLHDIADARVELEAAIADPTSSSLGLASAALTAGGKSSFWSLRSVAAIATSILLTALTMLSIGWSLWPEPPTKPPPPPLERYSVALPQRESQVTTHGFPTIGLSANGTLLSYSAGPVRERFTDDGLSILLRRRDQRLPTTLVQDAGRAFFPTVSPNGKWLAYFDASPTVDAILRVSVQGGPSTKLCDAEFVLGLTWTVDGDLVFCDRHKPGRLMRIGQNGGTPEEIVLPNADQEWPRFVHAMPDGQAVLYALSESEQGSAGGSIEVYSFKTQQSKRLVENGNYPLYAASGHLLFLRQSTLMVAAMDSQSLERTSEPVPAVEGIISGRYGAAGVAITGSGTLYYREGGARGDDSSSSIYQEKLEGDGKPEVFSTHPRRLERLSISHDGRFLAIMIRDEDAAATSIWLLDANRDVLTLLSTEAGSQDHAIFSPDGSWVFYSGWDEDRKWLGLFRRKRDTSGEAERVYDGPRTCAASSISSDGKVLFVTEYPSEELSPGTGSELSLIQLDADGDQAIRNITAVLSTSAASRVPRVGAQWSDVADAMTEELKWRSMHDCVLMLFDLLNEPIQTWFEIRETLQGPVNWQVVL